MLTNTRFGKDRSRFRWISREKKLRLVEQEASDTIDRTVGSVDLETTLEGKIGSICLAFNCCFRRIVSLGGYDIF